MKLREIISWFKKQFDQIENESGHFVQLPIAHVKELVRANQEAAKVMKARVEPAENNYGNADYMAREWLKRWWK